MISSSSVVSGSTDDFHFGLTKPPSVSCMGGNSALSGCATLQDPLLWSNNEAFVGGPWWSATLDFSQTSTEFGMLTTQKDVVSKNGTIQGRPACQCLECKQFFTWLISIFSYVHALSKTGNPTDYIGLSKHYTYRHVITQTSIFVRIQKISPFTRRPSATTPQLWHDAMTKICSFSCYFYYKRLTWPSETLYLRRFLKSKLGHFRPNYHYNNQYYPQLRHFFFKKDPPRSLTQLSLIHI